MAQCELATDSGFDAFLKQIRPFAAVGRNVHRRTHDKHLPCIHPSARCVVSRFSIHHTGSANMTLSGRDKSRTWQMRVQFVSLDFAATLSKGHASYDNVCWEHDIKDKPQTVTVERKNIPLFAVPVGDLIVHHYYAYLHNKTKKTDAKTETKDRQAMDKTEAESKHKQSKQDEEKDVMEQHIRKALRIDTTSADYRELLGLDSGWTFELWDSIQQPGFNTKLKHNFQSFCQQFMYFQTEKLGRVDRVTDVWTPDKAAVRSFFESLAKPSYVRKLLGYFLYNSDPSARGSTVEITRFDPPKSIPDILRSQHEQSENPATAQLLQHVTCRLNARLTRQLDTLCPKITVKSVRHVPRHYPVFAYRNVSVSVWVVGGYEDSETHIRNAHDPRHEELKDARAKHRLSKNEGKALALTEVHKFFGRYFGHRGHSKNRLVDRDRRKEVCWVKRELAGKMYGRVNVHHN